MPKKKPPTLVRDIAGLPDEVLAELHRRFGFSPGFSIQFMSAHLHTAAMLYWWYLPAATAKQKAKQLQRIEKLTNQLLDALGGESVAFVDVEPPGLRRPLLEMRDKAAQMATAYGTARPERGRRPEHDLHGFVRQAQFVYFHGTGRTDKYTWNDVERRYQGRFFEFVRAVANLYGIQDSDSSIVDEIQFLERNGLLYGKPERREIDQP